MSTTVEGAGVALSCWERGAGPPVLAIHGIGGGADDAVPLAAALGGDVRVIAYDRRGYRRSGAPEVYEGTTVYEQCEDAAALLEELGAVPAILCGDGLGALVALDLILRHPTLARGAVLVDPPLYAFVPEATEALSAESDALALVLHERGPASAMQAWCARAGLSGAEHAEHDHRAFFADLAAVSSWPVTRAQLRGIAAPVAVVSRPGAPPHVVAAGEALARLVGDEGLRRDGDVAAALRDVLGRG